MTTRKGIILAGGSGTRLYPITMGVSKQLLPVYDKPMIYYPLSVLMLAGIREIAIITTPAGPGRSSAALLGDGSQWGLALTYIVQPSPDGLAQAYLLAEDFLAGAPSAHGAGRQHLLRPRPARDAGRGRCARTTGGTVFGYRVADPERYGVVDFDADGTRHARSSRSPTVPPSNYAVTGLYFLDGTAPERARSGRRPRPAASWRSPRCWRSTSPTGALTVERMGRGYAWLDTGTHGSPARRGQFRAHAGRAAGPADRLPRRDRLSSRAGSTAPGWRRGRRCSARPATGAYLAAAGAGMTRGRPGKLARNLPDRSSPVPGCPCYDRRGGGSGPGPDRRQQ